MTSHTRRLAPPSSQKSRNRVVSAAGLRPKSAAARLEGADAIGDAAGVAVTRRQCSAFADALEAATAYLISVNAKTLAPMTPSVMEPSHIQRLRVSAATAPSAIDTWMNATLSANRW